MSNFGSIQIAYETTIFNEIDSFYRYIVTYQTIYCSNLLILVSWLLD